MHRLNPFDRERKAIETKEAASNKEKKN